MNKGALLLSMAAVAVLTVAIPALAKSPHAKEIAGAQAATHPWLSLVDAGRYSEAWKTASAVFRKGVTEKEWDQSVEQIRGSDKTDQIAVAAAFRVQNLTTEWTQGRICRHSVRQHICQVTASLRVRRHDAGLGKWKTAYYYVTYG